MVSSITPGVGSRSRPALELECAPGRRVTAMTTYHLLGQTGLRVSPIALGAMTFGEGGWYAGEDIARSVFLRYVEAGGNFLDTAINYAEGRSEEMLGRFMEETGLRERLVVAT